MIESEMTVKIANRYIHIQESEEGYDYTITDDNYEEIDGGLYENTDVTIEEALNDIISDLKNNQDYNGSKGDIQSDDEPIIVDSDEFNEKF